ncbi:TonB-dependent receptor [Croceicoccus mobilis]|uniref:TonB-dependent receptor n=1 Tax=Croceicoccus mobilis TaxID=1703339 RepID=A0A916Z895_9SPHN|nr:TonB-dependent receptor [Croceicoccus mobilis]
MIVSVALAAIAAAGGTAHAQDGAAGDNANAQDEAARMSEIVVTARKRAETIQDVPTTVTAINDAALDVRAATDIRYISGFVPNVTIEQATTSSTGSQIFLRGIGIDNTGFNVDPTVGVYLDDIFVGRLIGSMLGAVDMERVEVLRGPQGTLYGRNATAGAVKYVTRKPDVYENAGKFAATFGSRDRITLRGSANLVLVPDRLALLVSAQYHKQDGYIRLNDEDGNDTGLRSNGRDLRDIRAALRYQPTDDLTIDIAADYSHNRSGLQSVTPTNCGALGTVDGYVYDSANDAFIPGQVNAGQLNKCPLFYDDPYESYIGPFGFNDPKFDSAGVSGVVEYDLGPASIKSVTGYRGFRDIFVSALYAKPLPYVNVNLVNRLEQRQFQQEFQLSSNGQSLIDYTLGLFYYHEDIDSDYRTQVAFGAGPLPTPRKNLDSQKTDAYAVYGEVYIHPLDGLELTLGGRMSWDRKSVSRELYPTADLTTPTLTYDGKIKDSVFTPKLGVSYQLDDVLLYASYAEGYRSAGWANTTGTSLANLALTFDRETEESYEVGVKSQWFDRALTLNLAAFEAKYNNLQATLTLASTGSTVVTQSDARIRGLELEGALRPADGLTIYGNMAVMKDKYLSPPPGLYYAKRLKHLVRTSFLVGFDYETDAGFVPGSFFMGADLRYQGPAFRNVANTIDQSSPSYTLLGARAGYRAPDDAWSLTLGGSNLTDEEYFLLGIENNARSYQAPREIFLTFAVNY